MKELSKPLLAVYLFVLLWLVLFKFSMHPGSVIANYHVRVIDLDPFSGVSKDKPTEILYNVFAFIPLGVLLSVVFKQKNFWHKLIFILFLSISVEITQYVLEIGRTDITDVMTNTVGGYLGLAIYGLAQKHIDKDRLDRFIVLAGTILIVLFLLLRFFVLRFRYQSS